MNLALPVPRLSYRSASLFFVFIAVAALFFADLAISALDPAAEFKRLLAGALTPAFSAIRIVERDLDRCVRCAWGDDWSSCGSSSGDRVRPVSNGSPFGGISPLHP